VLRFSPEVENEIYYKIWFDEFEIIKDSEGYIILKTEQPITNRLAAWCVSWWDKIRITSPIELEAQINQMIKAYKKQR